MWTVGTTISLAITSVTGGRTRQAEAIRLRRSYHAARWGAYRATLCRVTKVMSSSCSHLFPVKE
jgi:hypothetical protein